MSIHPNTTVLAFSLIFFASYKFFKKKRWKNFKKSRSDGEKPFSTVIDLKKEKKIRRQWLISFFAFIVISVMTVFINQFGEEIFKEFPDKTQLSYVIPLGLLVAFLLQVPWVWITYYCSYKKKGSDWLLWLMISLLMQECFSFAREGWSLLAEMDSFDWLFLSVSIGLEAFYWVSCLQLYKINSSREYQNLAISP